MTKNPVVLLILASLVFLLPFVTRPLFVNEADPYSKALALPAHWSHPSPSTSSTTKWEPHAGPGESNPPLYFYLLAAFTKVAGPDLWKAHLLIIAITIAGVLAFYSLARLYTNYPGWAALVWLVSPHVWLTANSLLIDSLVAPFMLIGLAFWIKGRRERRAFYSALGAFFLGLAPLVTYTGGLGILLAAAWTALESGEKKLRDWLWLALPIGMFLAWIVGSRHQGAVTAVFSMSMLKSTFPTGSHWITLAAFAPATTPVLVFAAAVFLFRGPRSLRAASWCLFLAFVAFGLISGYKRVTGLQLSFWVATFAVWILSVTPEENKFWPADAFLLGWSVLAFVEAAFAMRWVCGHLLVVASPAWVLLSIRTLERRCPTWATSPYVRAGVLGALTFFSAGLIVSDWRQARAEVTAAIGAEAWRVHYAPGSAAYYPEAAVGGLGFYLLQNGWHPLPPGKAAPKGSLVLLPVRTLPTIFWPHLMKPRLVAQWPSRFMFPFRTLDAVGGSGYYGSIWGPLPYSFSTAPLDVYVLVQTG